VARVGAVLASAERSPSDADMMARASPSASYDPSMPLLQRVSSLFDRLDDRSADETLADAREALAYWRRREAGLAWHQRAARAEARDHIARWHEHVERAQLERWGLDRHHVLAPFVGALGLPGRERARRVATLALATGLARRLRRLVVMATVVTAAAFLAVALLVDQIF
jgi:hypothetical protein